MKKAIIKDIAWLGLWAFGMPTSVLALLRKANAESGTQVVAPSAEGESGTQVVAPFAESNSPAADADEDLVEVVSGFLENSLDLLLDL